VYDCDAIPAVTGAPWLQMRPVTGGRAYRPQRPTQQHVSRPSRRRSSGMQTHHRSPRQ
jgi:hypothetical protein